MEPKAARTERLLEIEFEHLQRINDKYDASRFSIKNWAVTTAAGAFALSATAREPALAIIGGAAIGVFAYLEILYIYIQDHVVARSNHIEHLLDSAAHREPPKRLEDYRFGISQAFVGSFDLRGVVTALRGRPHIYVLYIALMTASVAEALVLSLAR